MDAAVPIVVSSPPGPVGSQPLEAASGYHAHVPEMLPSVLSSASPYSCLIEVPTPLGDALLRQPPKGLEFSTRHCEPPPRHAHSVDDAFLRQPPKGLEFAMRYCEPPLRLEPVR
jgi:hypothetical protein